MKTDDIKDFQSCFNEDIFADRDIFKCRNSFSCGADDFSDMMSGVNNFCGTVDRIPGSRWRCGVGIDDDEEYLTRFYSSNSF